MSVAVLLDANVLIALADDDHEHHARTAAWSAGIGTVAVCPITEGALMRHLLRAGHTASSGQSLLVRLHESGVEFWPDDVSYVDASLGHVTGYRQMTDAYLAALAEMRGTTLATLDGGLAAVRPDVVTLIP